MEHAEIVLHLLLPPDQDPPEPVHPAVGPFDHPAAGLEPRLTLQRLRLLAPRPHMRREPELPDQLPGVVIVITLVQTHPLRLRLRGLGAPHRDALQGRLDQPLVVAVGPLSRQPPPPPVWPRQPAPPRPPPPPLRPAPPAPLPPPPGPRPPPRPLPTL